MTSTIRISNVEYMYNPNCKGWVGAIFVYIQDNLWRCWEWTARTCPVLAENELLANSATHALSPVTSWEIVHLPYANIRAEMLISGSKVCFRTYKYMSYDRYTWWNEISPILASRCSLVCLFNIADRKLRRRTWCGSNAKDIFEAVILDKTNCLLSCVCQDFSIFESPDVLYSEMACIYQPAHEIWHLSYIRAVRAQASLCKCAGRQSLRCLHTQSMCVDEGSGQHLHL